MFGASFIARKELLAALVALYCFQDLVRGSFAFFVSDNHSAVQWLKKGRSSNTRGNLYLTCWALLKYELDLVN